VRVAVTGATGFTGRRVVSELLRRGHEVTALVRPPAARLAARPGMSVVEGDMADARAVAQLMGGAEAFVHAASLGFGHARVVTEAVEAACPRRSVVFSSTALFTRLPAASRAIRLAAEERVPALSSDWTIVRPTMIYGAAGDRNMERLIRFLARSPIVPLPGAGRALIQPVHVEDLGRAAVDALLCPAARRAYNLAGADPAPPCELVTQVAGLLGRRPPLVTVPVGRSLRRCTSGGSSGCRPDSSRSTCSGCPRARPSPTTRPVGTGAYAPRRWRERLAGEVAALRA
jgi:uncharacterized protein YbjT (DUF2867 family)